MAKLIICRGIPASGKTTWAREQLESNPDARRVNRDDLRAMMLGGKWNRGKEPQIKAARDSIILDCLMSGHNVICDDTNIDSGTVDHLKSIAAEHGHKVEVKNFDTPLEECIERNSKRPNPVPESAIRRMWHQKYGSFGAVVYAPQDDSLPKVLICDIDGTVAIMNGRGPFDWKKVGSDIPHAPVLWSLSLLSAGVEKVIFVSGRDECCRDETERWIRENVETQPKLHFVPWSLIMRPENDRRRDSIVKKEIYETEIAGKYNVALVLDDRNQTVAAWRELGLPCFQVAPGDF